MTSRTENQRKGFDGLTITPLTENKRLFVTSRFDPLRGRLIDVARDEYQKMTGQVIDLRPKRCLQFDHLNLIEDLCIDT